MIEKKDHDAKKLSNVVALLPLVHKELLEGSLLAH